MIIIILISAVLLIMGIVILIGKGDNLIAGYNLATEEEKKKNYHVKRLRFLIGGLLVVSAALTFIMMKEPSTANTMSFVASTFVLCIIAVVLANTWAKKR